MSDSPTIRQTLQTLLRERDTPPTRSELVINANLRCAASAPAIAGELDELERLGEVYTVGDDDPVVKVP
jgi:hypothetical protein